MLTRLHRSKHWGDARELGIEVARVRSARDLRNEGCRNPLVIDIVPVDVPEESVAHNLLRIGRARSDS